jgi:hypothetical protein
MAKEEESDTVSAGLVGPAIGLSYLVLAWSWSREKGKFLNIIALGIYLNIMCSILNGIWAKIWIQIEINKELNILDHGHIGNCTIIEIDNIV